MDQGPRVQLAKLLIHLFCQDGVDFKFWRWRGQLGLSGLASPHLLAVDTELTALSFERANQECGTAVVTNIFDCFHSFNFPVTLDAEPSLPRSGNAVSFDASFSSFNINPNHDTRPLLRPPLQFIQPRYFIQLTDLPLFEHTFIKSTPKLSRFGSIVSDTFTLSLDLYSKYRNSNSFNLREPLDLASGISGICSMSDF
ncbi:hypothetical protein B0H16DRAFT_1700655 [Mycena metata]|uniref:Uncharacterized protein n=1 Tax=Mycena metata TaxID=1033252 RepID=A0AAD7HDZ7_9AGAR|nr:hypothetical protein B0H16DRAFT_1700655 [Mycena metata]